MGKTVRKVNFHTARSAQRILDEGGYDRGDTVRLNRNAQLRLKGVRSYSSDKCQTAYIDSEGGYKLNTWSECHSKHDGQQAKRKLRRAGKILINVQQLD